MVLGVVETWVNANPIGNNCFRRYFMTLRYSRMDAEHKILGSWRGAVDAPIT